MGNFTDSIKKHGIEPPTQVCPICKVEYSWDGFKRHLGSCEAKHKEAEQKEISENGLTEVISLLKQIKESQEHLPENVLNALGSHIVERVVYEMNEYWKGFSKDIGDIGEQYKKLHNQNGLIINKIGSILKGNKLKSGKHF